MFENKESMAGAQKWELEVRSIWKGKIDNSVKYTSWLPWDKKAIGEFLMQRNKLVFSLDALLLCLADEKKLQWGNCISREIH